MEIGETKKLAEKVAKDLKPNKILALYGDLGSGKTTFTRFLVKALGFDSRVQSPTFVVTREYKITAGSTKESKIKKIYHVDLYRLQTREGVWDIGFEEMLKDKDAIVIVEWPNIAEDFFPADVVKINFEYGGKGERIINVQNKN